MGIGGKKKREVGFCVLLLINLKETNGRIRFHYLLAYKYKKQLHKLGIMFWNQEGTRITKQGEVAGGYIACIEAKTSRSKEKWQEVISHAQRPKHIKLKKFS